MTTDDIIKMYVEKFGKEPEFKGRTWGLEDFEIAQLLLKAIDTGEPYFEEDIKEDEVL